MPRKRRRKTESLEVVNRDCAGIDIGKDVHYVAVDPERCGDRGSPVPTHANQRNRFPEPPGSSHARQAPKRIPPENVTNAPSIIVSTLTNVCLKDAFGARHVRVRGTRKSIQPPHVRSARADG